MARTKKQSTEGPLAAARDEPLTDEAIEMLARGEYTELRAASDV